MGVDISSVRQTLWNHRPAGCQGFIAVHAMYPEAPLRTRMHSARQRLEQTGLQQKATVWVDDYR